SSAYYAGGEAEGYIGKTAPWFILAIMLFSYAVRAVYVESCSMFVRGGVYRAVKMSLGGTLAKFSVSALMFDYILTGPISGVAAGRYLAGLTDELLQYFHVSGPLPSSHVRRSRRPYCPRPFRSGDERRGIACAGLSRNREPQAPQPEKSRSGHFCLQPGFYVFGLLLCRDDYSGRRPPAFPREPD